MAGLLFVLPWAVGSCELICEVPPPVSGDAGGDGELFDGPESDGPVDGDEADDAGLADGADGDVPASCGNGEVDRGEECDDGNGVEDDGCRSDCRFGCRTDFDCVGGDPCVYERCVAVGTGRRCEAGGAGPPPPAPLWPPNGARTGSLLLPAERQALRPRLRWRPSACPGVSYDVQVDDSCPAVGFGGCEFASPEGSATGLAATSWQPATDLAIETVPPVGRRYFWRVRSVLPGVGPGPWSPVRYVDVGRAPGDLDGDGLADLAVGAPGDATGAGTGRVYVFCGAAAVPDDTPDVVFEVRGGSRFGELVAAAGDVDGDGYGDLLVGDPEYSTTGRGHGAAFLFRGGDPPSTMPALVLEGTANGERLGAAVAGAGDVDADGAADWLVGVPSADATVADAGRVLLLRGGVVPEAEVDRVLDGFEPGGRYGAAVAGAGDVNGDGFGDFLVYEPGGFGAGGVRSGAAFLYSGGPVDSIVVPAQVWAGAGDGEEFGAAMAGMGDLNGDGFEEVAIGAPGADGLRGRVELFRGGVVPGATAGAALEGWAAGDRFGGAVGGAGDVNGDGVPDLLVGAPLADGVAIDAGRAYLFLGGWPPVSTPARVLEEEAAADDEHGAVVAGVGDLDADGFADVAVGAPGFDGARSGAGRVVVWRGPVEPSAEPVLAPEGAMMNAAFGSAVAAAR